MGVAGRDAAVGKSSWWEMVGKDNIRHDWKKDSCRRVVDERRSGKANGVGVAGRNIAVGTRG